MNARIERLNELLKQSPDDTFIRFALAKEMEKLGRYEEAIDRLLELLAVDSKYIGAYYHLGALQHHTGKTEEAKKTYRIGMEVASSLNDGHALGELQQAMANLETE